MLPTNGSALSLWGIYQCGKGVSDYATDNIIHVLDARQSSAKLVYARLVGRKVSEHISQSTAFSFGADLRPQHIQSPVFILPDPVCNAGYRSVLVYVFPVSCFQHDLRQ